MAERYQRQSLFSPPGVSNAPAEASAALAQAFRDFGARSTDLVASQRQRQGELEGAAAGASGVVQTHRRDTAYTRAYERAAEAAYLSRQRADLANTAERLEQEHFADPDGYQNAFGAYEAETLKNVPVQYRPSVALMVNELRGRGENRVREQFRIQDDDRQRADLTAGLEALSGMAARASGERAGPGEGDGILTEAVVEANMRIGALEESGALTSAQAIKAREAFAESLEAGVATARVGAAVERVSDVDRIDIVQGTAALSDEALADYTSEERQQIRNEVRARRSNLFAQRAIEYADERAAIALKLGAGEYDPALDARARTMFRRGAVSDGEYASMIAKNHENHAALAARSATRDAITQAVDLGRPLDPADRDVRRAVDTWFTDAAAQANLTPGSPQWVNEASRLAARTNILPDSAVSWARATIASGDPALTAPAAAAMTRFRDANPVAYAFFEDTKTKAFAEQMDGLIKAGVDPVRADEIARTNTFAIPEARAKQLEQTYRQEKIADDNPGELRSRLNDDDAFDRRVFGGAPPAPLGMQDDFDTLVREYYRFTNGDIDRARSLAYANLRGVYGYSQVNGEPQIVKYAPELVFPGIDVGVIRTDAQQAAASLGYKGDPARVQLVPSGITGESHGLRWSLQVTDEDGAPEVLLDDKNRPVIYEIPTDTARYREAAEAHKRAAVEAARAEDARRQAILEEQAQLNSRLLSPEAIRRSAR